MCFDYTRFRNYVLWSGWLCGRLQICLSWFDSSRELQIIARGRTVVSSLGSYPKGRRFESGSRIKVYGHIAQLERVLGYEPGDSGSNPDMTANMYG